MTEIGEFIDSDSFAIVADVNGKNGIRGGIFHNKQDNSLFLIQNMRQEDQKYPNYWDKGCIGLLHYCGTDKGITSRSEGQSVNPDTLNGLLKEGKCPIHLYLRENTNRYCYFGRFTRLPKYDEKLKINNRLVYRFGLVSNNIDVLTPRISEIARDQIDLEVEFW